MTYKIKEIEDMYRKYPWIMNHDLLDDISISAIIYDNTFYFSNLLHQNFHHMEEMVLHPLLRKFFYDQRYSSVLSWFSEAAGSKREEMLLPYTRMLEKKEIEYATQLASLPKKYLSESDFLLISEVTIRKLTK